MKTPIFLVRLVLLCFLSVCFISFTSCSDDDDSLWGKSPKIMKVPVSIVEVKNYGTHTSTEIVKFEYNNDSSIRSLISDDRGFKEVFNFHYSLNRLSRIDDNISKEKFGRYFTYNDKLKTVTAKENDSDDIDEWTLDKNGYMISGGYKQKESDKDFYESYAYKYDQNYNPIEISQINSYTKNIETTTFSTYYSPYRNVNIAPWALVGELDFLMSTGVGQNLMASSELIATRIPSNYVWEHVKKTWIVVAEEDNYPTEIKVDAESETDGRKETYSITYTIVYEILEK